MLSRPVEAAPNKAAKSTQRAVSKAGLPLRRRDCDSIKKKVDYTEFMASRHRIVVALVGEASLQTEGSTTGRL
jgi:hypothetical protein